MWEILLIVFVIAFELFWHFVVWALVRLRHELPEDKVTSSSESSRT